MPEIEITPEQQERLREVQEDLASDVVGKYGHVRPRDAVEYLLDRYETDEATDGDAAPAADGAAPEGDANADSGAAADGATAGDATDGAADSGGDDAMLDEMMSLLDTHDDKWGESSGDERYAVELPDGSSEHVRTKDDVKALLFEHYR
jgi:hypothetical protein